MTRPVRREGRAASLRRLSVFSHAKGGALLASGFYRSCANTSKGGQSGHNMSLKPSLTMN